MRADRKCNDLTRRGSRAIAAAARQGGDVKQAPAESPQRGARKQMGREEKRLFTVGPFWLAQREQSPFYQIRWYDERAKVTRGKSTRCRALDDAIVSILAHHEAWRAKQRQEPDEALRVASSSNSGMSVERPVETPLPSLAHSESSWRSSI
jgi:hypothetical protein